VRYSWFVNAPMVTGRGSLEHLAQIGARRVALVADTRALAATGALQRAGDLLTRTGCDWTLVHDVRQEPRMRDVQEAVPAMRAYAPDAILAMGGGSALDVAKALWFFYEVPDATWDMAFAAFALPRLGVRARLIAVPTTSGTGSETTCVAVLVDEGGRKRLMMSRELIPSLAILDPDLVDSMPSQVASSSGMDALTHAIEAAVCTIASPMVTAVAVEAAAGIMEWLTASVAAAPGSPERRQAREMVHYAASRAGMAINNSSAGLAHAMDQIGPLLGIPHGLACSLALPYTVAFTGLQPAFSILARRLGGSGDDAGLSRHLVGRIWKLGRDLGLPAGLRECGVSERQFAPLAEALSREAAGSGSARLAPAAPDEDGFARMFWQVFRGAPPLAG